MIVVHLHCGVGTFAPRTGAQALIRHLMLLSDLENQLGRILPQSVFAT